MINEQSDVKILCSVTWYFVIACSRHFVKIYPMRRPNLAGFLFITKSMPTEKRIQPAIVSVSILRR